MFSFLGELVNLMLVALWKIPQTIVKEVHLTVDGFVRFIGTWLGESRNSPQQTNGSSSVGPPGHRLTFLWSFLRPTPLARVRVSARRSIR